MRHISNLRVSMFMSKLSLNKHQRALVGNFEQYTIDDMVAEDDNDRQRDKVLDLFARNDMFDSNERAVNQDILGDPQLSQTQKDLLVEIREKFKPADHTPDLCILYEITKYKDESAKADFWDHYEDFAEPGDQDALVKPAKLKKKDLKVLMNM